MTISQIDNAWTRIVMSLACISLLLISYFFQSVRILERCDALCIVSSFVSQFAKLWNPYDIVMSAVVLILFTQIFISSILNVSVFLKLFVMIIILLFYLIPSFQYFQFALRHELVPNYWYIGQSFNEMIAFYVSFIINIVYIIRRMGRFWPARLT